MRNLLPAGRAATARALAVVHASINDAWAAYDCDCRAASCRPGPPPTGIR
jgi:hypothetical protein